MAWSKLGFRNALMVSGEWMRAWLGTSRAKSGAHALGEALDPYLSSFAEPPEYAFLTKITDQTLIGTAATKVVGWALTEQVGGFSLNTDILTVPAEGLYLVAVTAPFHTFTAAAGHRGRLELRNGANTVRYHGVDNEVNPAIHNTVMVTLSGALIVSASDLTLCLSAYTTNGTMTLGAGGTTNVRWLVVRIR